jgi:SOS-response transcriptional repressor LexA
MPPAGSQPTARQREYLSFIRTFTDRWGIPPSFEEIARHFKTTTPSVNGMVKTLEARGFLARIPGAARTLRVLVPDEALCQPAPAKAATKAAATAYEVAAYETTAYEATVRMASAAVERLVPALAGADSDHLYGALGAVKEALAIALQGARRTGS